MHSLRIRRFDTKSKKQVNYKINDSIEDFRSLGHGIYFYFFFLKFFAIVFGIISLISLVPIIMNVQGNGLKAFGDANIFLKTSLGNMQDI